MCVKKIGSVKEWSAENVEEVGVQRPCGHERGKMNESAEFIKRKKDKRENLGLF